MVVRFALEWVVHVGAATAEEGDQGCDEVGGDEEGSPAFGLFDVDALVGASCVEEVTVAAEDNVAEGHGAGAAAEEGAVLEDPGNDAAVDFQDAVDALGAAAGE